MEPTSKKPAQKKPTEKQLYKAKKKRAVAAVISYEIKFRELERGVSDLAHRIEALSRKIDDKFSSVGKSDLVYHNSKYSTILNGIGELNKKLSLNSKERFVEKTEADFKVLSEYYIKEVKGALGRTTSWLVSEIEKAKNNG